MHELIIVCGNAGTGKSTFAQKLAQERAALLLDLDTVSEQLVVAGLQAMGHDPDDRDSPRYKTIYRAAIHETLFAVAAENLPHASCILVAPFTQERRDPHFLQDCKSRCGCSVSIYYVTCDEETRKARIEQRKNPRDRLKLQDWSPYSELGKDTAPPPFEHYLVDTSKS
jgi:predicted kinase